MQKNNKRRSGYPQRGPKINNEDFNKLMRVLDVPSVGPLPVINSAQRPPNTQVSQFSRDTLKEIYSKDFELFEYDSAQMKITNLSG